MLRNTCRCSCVCVCVMENDETRTHFIPVCVYRERDHKLFARFATHSPSGVLVELFYGLSLLLLFDSFYCERFGSFAIQTILNIFARFFNPPSRRWQGAIVCKPFRCGIVLSPKKKTHRLYAILTSVSIRSSNEHVIVFSRERKIISQQCV